MRGFIGVMLSVLAVTVGIWVMMEGWGLEPQSWPAIIGGTVAVIILNAIAFVVAGD